MQPTVLRAAALVAALAAAPLAAPLAAQSPAAASAPDAPRAKPAPLPADSLEIARKYTTWFYTALGDSLVAHGTEESRVQMTKEFYIGRLAEVTSRAGVEQAVLEERFVTRKGARQYWRTSTFSDFDEPIMIRWVITPKGEIAGLGINPKSQAPPIDPD